MDEEKELTKKELRTERREEKKKDIERARSKKTVKKIATWIIVLGVLGGGVYALTRLDIEPPQHSAEPEGSLAVGVSENDWIKGNAEAPVTLVEYGDFQCPACALYHPVVKRLSEDMGDRVRIVYRHFPLRQIHPHAQIAAQATEAAGLQGKFWEMHDKIFENQGFWTRGPSPREIFIAYAEELGLDVEKFRQDIDSDDVRDRVEEDLQSGIRSGVAGTPSFYVNGEKIQSPQSLEEFVSIIDAASAQP